ncbi:hypothetical protein [Microbacterium sp. No. 7]|uniref:hypothetical protein n=1 Tax=Microbacterium sp. No. 7 TaxID=1714373 RepID=UPI0006CFE1D1|nr:hypothetical protein [Microbacterium sp. No. 7]ALJ19509.1 hypothetical protein AOA12_06145 [Microbacterium sp. No. 7]
MSRKETVPVFGGVRDGDYHRLPPNAIEGYIAVLTSPESAKDRTAQSTQYVLRWQTLVAEGLPWPIFAPATPATGPGGDS